MAVASGIGADTAEKNQEAAMEKEVEERRLRQALARTNRQLEGHRERNASFEVAIARSLEEKEAHLPRSQVSTLRGSGRSTPHCS